MALDLDPPALVVGQVQVQHVELVGGHQVQEAQHVRLRQEVPADVQQHAAPAEPRRVLDVTARQHPAVAAQRGPAVGVGAEQLAQGLRAPERSGGAAGGDHGAPGTHRQPVLLGGQPVVQGQLDPGLARAARAQRQPGRGGQRAAQPLLHRLQTGGGDERGVLVQGEVLVREADGAQGRGDEVQRGGSEVHDLILPRRTANGIDQLQDRFGLIRAGQPLSLPSPLPSLGWPMPS